MCKIKAEMGEEWGNRSIKQEIDVARQQGQNTAIDDLGAISEILLHALDAVERIDDDGGVKNDLALFNKRAGQIVTAVLPLF